MVIPDLPNSLLKYVHKLQFPSGLEGCWIWNGTKSGGRNYKPYGVIQFGGEARKKQYRAHRVFYERLVGAIPEGLTLDHLCETKLCVNPKHLEPVTSSENARRWYRNHGVEAIGFCKNGHAATAENRKRTKGGVVYCRLCRNAYKSKLDKLKRAAANPNYRPRVPGFCIYGHPYEGNRRPVKVGATGTYCIPCNNEVSKLKSRAKRERLRLERLKVI